VTDFDRLEWKKTAKGQRSALGPEDWPPGTYTLTRDWGIPDFPGFLPKGSLVNLTTGQATRMRDHIEEEGR
jgi:hypothetical protein